MNSPFTRCEVCGALAIRPDSQPWRCAQCRTVRQPGFDDSPTPQPDSSSPLRTMAMSALVVAAMWVVGIVVYAMCRGGSS